MDTYKLQLGPVAADGSPSKPIAVASSRGCSIPFAPDNTDYAEFKQQILAGKAELQDADGMPMSAEQAQDYVKGLP